MRIQVPSIILPSSGSLPGGLYTGTEIQGVIGTSSFVSHEIDTGNPMGLSFMETNTIFLSAIEVVGLGAPGVLWCWIELSPYPSTITTGYWAAIGGGGGTLPPTSPITIAGIGTNGTQHTIILPWSTHAPYARLVVQTPVNSATAYWGVQAMWAAKGAA